MRFRTKMAVALFAGFATVAGVALPANAQQARYYDFGSQQWREGTADTRTQVRQRQQGQARSTQAMHRVDPRFQRQQVSIETRERPGTIIVDTERKFLYHVEGNGLATRYGVGVGRQGFTWAGSATIGRKAEWPGWTPPAAMRERERREGRNLPAFMPGGPENPLGARALYLYQGGRDTLYRIHGTNQPWSIGQSLSSGCIRMMNEDVIHLYERARNGSKVVVIGPGGNRNNVYAETGTVRQASAENPLARLFSSSVQ